MATPDEMAQFEVPPGDEDGHISNAMLNDPNYSYVCHTQPSKYPVGVVYKGPYEELNDGVCVAVRRHACALRSTGMSVFLQSSSYSMAGEDGVRYTAKYSDIDDEVRAEVDHLTTLQHSKTLFTIHHVVPTDVVMRNIVYPRQATALAADQVRHIRARTILYVVFERDRIDPQMVAMFNQVGRIWVPCSANARMLKRCGVVTPIEVIPHPVQPTDPFLTMERKPHHVVRFLNVGKWEPRKGQHELIGAFLYQFRPEDNCELILKTRDWGTWKDYPKTSGESLASWMKDEQVVQHGWSFESAAKKIKIVSARLSRADLGRLYSECDVYIACGHGEGFDLPAFDARMMRLPIAYCPNSGAADFAGPDDDQIRSVPVPCHPQYNWEANACWDGYEIQELAQVMQRLTFLGIESAPLDTSQYSMATIGQKMKSSIEQLACELGTDTKDLYID